MAARRWLAVAALCGYAGLALGSGLDRASERRPDLAPHVPGIFSVHASRSLALKAVIAGDGETAVGYARRAVIADPINAQSLGLLGQSYFISGKPVQARPWFVAAGKLGWREPFTQAYWMANAIDARDFTGAATRLDAILRQFPGFADRAKFLALFEDDDGGREALAGRLAADPVWAHGYFDDTWTSDAATRTARSDVAQRMARQYGALDCAMIMPLVQKQVVTGAIADAHMTWQLHCAPGGGATQVPYDGEFERTALEGARASFEWTLSNDGALDIGIAPAPGLDGNALVVSSSAPGQRAVAWQLLALKPGRWSVGWRTNGAGAATDVALYCGDEPRSPRAGVPVAGAPGYYRAQFDVRAGCTGTWLSLGVAAGARDVAIDNVTVRPG